MHLARLLAVVFILVAGIYVTPARAETYNTCAGFIDSLPATISTQGVWCLNKNLSTAITSGNAITIATNNVTIDCNDFKVGGLAAGDSSLARGIYADGHQNATVRHCAIRGFYSGIALNGAGHLVEDNRLDNNLHYGIRIHGDNNRVRRNAVFDTGGRPGETHSYAIIADADIVDNTVSGVFGTDTDVYVHGISGLGDGNTISGNRVRGLVPNGSGRAYGISGSGSFGPRISDNHVLVTSNGPTSYGISGGGDNAYCTDNTVIESASILEYGGCDYSSGNLPAPAP